MAPPALGVMRSYLTTSFRVMLLLSLLLGGALYLGRERWLQSFGPASPFPLLAALYSGLFLLIQRHSLFLMGRGAGWSGHRSPLFSVFLFRGVLVAAGLVLVAPLLSVRQPLPAVLGSLAVCVLIAAFFDNLRLLTRVKTT